jgi:hypothetical protein
MRTDTCATCRYWDRGIATDLAGICRVDSPLQLNASGPGGWRTTKNNYCCGKHAPLWDHREEVAIDKIDGAATKQFPSETD